MAIITSLSQKDALPYFRRMVAEAWSDMQLPKTFLQSLTKEKTTSSKAVSVEVQRRFRKIAAEVPRGGSPNLHRGDKSTEKVWVPPYFSDAVILNDLDEYTRVFGDGIGVVSRNDISSLTIKVIDGIIEIQNQQNRAIEKQVSDVLMTGEVGTLEGTVDYHRKDDSIITNTGTDLWDDADSDPLAQLLSDAQFISTQGNSGAARFNVIMGTNAHEKFMSNSAVLARGDYRYIKLMDLGMPNISANGSVLHGTVSAGSYQFYIWTYPQYYDLGTKTDGLKDTSPFIDADSYVMLSEDVELRSWKAGLPTVFKKETGIIGAIPTFSAGWSVHESVSQENQSHKAIVRVAPLIVPYSIDRIVTRTVLA